MANLRSVKAKINRANDHVGELDRAIAEYSTNPHTIRCEPNEDGSRHVFYWVLDDPDLLVKWSSIIGDYLHNLRSALDHMLYAAIRAENKQPTNTSFPIFTSEAKFHRLNSRTGQPTPWSGLNAIAQVGTPAVRGMIKNAQPYRRGHDPEFHALAVLDWLENTDKHGEIHPVFFIHQEGTVNVVLTPPPTEAAYVTVVQVVSEHDAPIFTVETEPGRHIQNVDFNFTTKVGIQLRDKTVDLKETLDYVGVGVVETLAMVGAALTASGL